MLSVDRVWLAGRLQGGVRGEINIAICHKHHIRDRASREQTPADQLADQKQTALLVGDGHHNPDRHKKHSAHPEC